MSLQKPILLILFIFGVWGNDRGKSIQIISNDHIVKAHRCIYIDHQLCSYPINTHYICLSSAGEIKDIYRSRSYMIISRPYVMVSYSYVTVPCPYVIVRRPYVIVSRLVVIVSLSSVMVSRLYVIYCITYVRNYVRTHVRTCVLMQRCHVLLDDITSVRDMSRKFVNNLIFKLRDWDFIPNISDEINTIKHYTPHKEITLPE